MSRSHNRTRVFFFLRVMGAGLLISLATSANAGTAASFSVFAEVPASMFTHAIQSGTSCSLDMVNQTPAQNAAIDHIGPASFVGWVADSSTGKVPEAISLVLDGDRDFYVRGFTGASRPDVPAAKHDAAFVKSGFRVDAYLADIPVGDYQVAIYYQVDGKTMVCPTNDIVSVQ
jgi:hypothetical protein